MNPCVHLQLPTLNVEPAIPNRVNKFSQGIKDIQERKLEKFFFMLATANIFVELFTPTLSGIAVTLPYVLLHYILLLGLNNQTQRMLIKR